MSWARATSPISSATGPVAAAATPNAVETSPSMPLAPRLASTRGGASRTGQKVSTSRTGIEDATTSVASGGSRTPSSAATRGSHSPAGPSAAAIAPAAARSGRGPGLEPVAGPRAARQALLQRVEDRARVGGRQRRHGARGVLPRGLGIERDLQRVLRQAAEPLAQRLGRRQVAHPQHELRRVRGGPRGVAQQRVVVGDGGRSAPRAGGRLGQQRHAGAVREARERRAELRVALRPPGDEHRARPLRELRGQAGDERVGRRGAAGRRG